MAQCRCQQAAWVEVLQNVRPDRNSKQALAAPLVTWNQFHLTHTTCFAAVYKHLHWLLNVCLQQLLQRLIVLVLQVHNSNFIHRESEKRDTILLSISLLNIDWFSQLFHRRTQLELCNKIINKDPTSPQMCCYTTLLHYTRVHICQCHKYWNHV